jgi:DNA (cytosine-5)-methyltransferase 1
VKAVDLFAGWGGFTLGANQAGLDVVYAANHWQTAVDVHERNHPNAVHACQDLRQADWSALPAYDVLLASPACQGHSGE